MRRPYNIHNPDDAMDVMGHHHEDVQFDMGEMVWCFGPTFPRNPPPCIQRHVFIHHPAEQRRAVMGADGDEIRPG